MPRSAASLEKLPRQWDFSISLVAFFHILILLTDTESVIVLGLPSDVSETGS